MMINRTIQEAHGKVMRGARIGELRVTPLNVRVHVLMLQISVEYNEFGRYV